MAGYVPVSLPGPRKRWSEVKDERTKLELIVDGVQKNSETRFSSTLVHLRGKLREEQKELLDHPSSSRPVDPNLSL
jgi:hypothetical protein